MFIVGVSSIKFFDFLFLFINIYATIPKIITTITPITIKAIDKADKPELDVPDELDEPDGPDEPESIGLKLETNIELSSEIFSYLITI